MTSLLYSFDDNSGAYHCRHGGAASSVAYTWATHISPLACVVRERLLLYECFPIVTLQKAAAVQLPLFTPSFLIKCKALGKTEPSPSSAREVPVVVVHARL
jgi:hypothetical protein